MLFDLPSPSTAFPREHYGWRPAWNILEDSLDHPPSRPTAETIGSNIHTVGDLASPAVNVALNEVSNQVSLSSQVKCHYFKT